MSWPSKWHCALPFLFFYFFSVQNVFVCNEPKKAFFRCWPLPKLFSLSACSLLLARTNFKGENHKCQSWLLLRLSVIHCAAENDYKKKLCTLTNILKSSICCQVFKMSPVIQTSRKKTMLRLSIPPTAPPFVFCHLALQGLQLHIMNAHAFETTLWQTNKWRFYGACIQGLNPQLLIVKHRQLKLPKRQLWH